MECHCSQIANASSLSLEKLCTSSGNCRPCPRLRAIRPPSPWAQFLNLEVTGRSLFSSIKVACHPTARGANEDATLDPTCPVRCAPLVDSQMTTATGVEAGGLLGGVSSGLTGDWTVVRGLFQVRAAKGG